MRKGTPIFFNGVGNFIVQLVYCVVLVVFFQASQRGVFSQDWFAAGAAQAGLIADGQWWRVFTALGLHVDIAHLFSNLALGSLLGVFLSQLLGPGLAWLAILLAVLAINLMGDGLRDALDPKMKRS